MSVAQSLNYHPQNQGFHNTQAINQRVAEVLSKLKKGHTRPEAFRALNDANIYDRKGNKIIPSVWYHSLCYVPKASGKTFMEEYYPKFVPTESPYVRPKIEHKEKVSEKAKRNEEILTFNTELMETVKSVSVTLNELAQSVIELRKQVEESLIKKNVASPKKAETPKNSVEASKEPEKKETTPPKKDNAIHASIHEKDKDIGVKNERAS